MSHRIFLLLFLSAHWPVWWWYLRRMTDRSDEPWGFLALVSALVFIPWRRLGDKVPASTIHTVAGLEVVFLLFGHLWMPLVRALFVVIVLGGVLLALRAPSGVLGLLCLSLPWIATLQFYAGFPLRVLTGEVSRWMLTVYGFNVQREGIVLLWNTKQVVIDRPCAGIYMLWFGGYLSYLLASLLKLNFRQCLILGAGSFLLILCANIVRSFVLFFLETGLVHAPAFAHEWVGMVLFLAAILLLAKITMTQVSGRALRSAD